MESESRPEVHGTPFEEADSPSQELMMNWGPQTLEK